MYGSDGTQNATHGSDSPMSALREIKFYFPSLVLEPLLHAEVAKDYITQRLQPALSKALTALAREKPSAEKFEAITFLADYLLKNNPNKPRIVTPDQWDPSLEDNEEDEEEDEFMQAELAAAAQRAASAQEQPAEAQAAPEVAPPHLPPPVRAMRGRLGGASAPTWRLHPHASRARSNPLVAPCACRPRSPAVARPPPQRLRPRSRTRRPRHPARTQTPASPARLQRPHR